MPLARISNFEQHEARRWTAELEAGGLAGGPNFRRVLLNAYSFDEMMQKLTDAYHELVPSDKPQTISLAQEGTMSEDNKDNPNHRPGQSPVQRSPGDQAKVEGVDASKDAAPSLPDNIRPDQRVPGPGGTNNADNTGLAPIPPTEEGNKLPGGRMSDEEIEDAKKRDEVHREDASEDTSEANAPADARTVSETDAERAAREQRERMERMKREEEQRREMENKRRNEQHKQATDRAHHTRVREHNKQPKPPTPQPIKPVDSE